MATTAQVILEFGVAGQKKVENELRSVERQIARLEKTKKTASKENKKAVSEELKGLKSTERILLRNQKAIISNTRAATTLAKGMGVTGSQLGTLNNSFRAHIKTLGKSDLNTRQFNTSTGRLSSTMKNINTSISKSAKASEGAVGKIKGHANALRNLSSSAVLTFGPLSGVGSRIIAMSAIFSRGNIAIAIFIISLIALTTLLAGGTKEANKLEVSLRRLTVILRNTGKSAKNTAKEFDDIAKIVDGKTLASIDNLRAATLILATVPGVDKTNLEKFLVKITEINEILGIGFAQTSRLFARVLKDPIANMDAFARSGATVSESLKNSVRNMVLFGDKLSAANLIVDNATNAIAGSSGAGKKGLADALDSAAKAWADFQESIGVTVIELVTSAVKGLTSSLKGLTKVVEFFKTTNLGKITRDSIIADLTNDILEAKLKVNDLATALGKVDVDSFFGQARIKGFINQLTIAKKELSDLIILRASKIGFTEFTAETGPTVKGAGIVKGPLSSFESIIASGDLDVAFKSNTVVMKEFKKSQQKAQIQLLETAQALRVLNGESIEVEKGMGALISKTLGTDKALTAAQLKIIASTVAFRDMNEQLRRTRLAEESFKVFEKIIKDAKNTKDAFNDLKISLAIFDETRTPLEKFSIKMAELDILVEDGIINWDLYIRKTKMVSEELEKATKTTVKMKDAFNDLKASLKIFDLTRTPLESFGIAIFNLDGLLESNIITIDIYLRRVKQLEKVLKDATKETKTLTEEQKLLKSIIKSVQTPLENYNNRMNFLNKTFNEGKISLENYRRASEQALNVLISADPLLNTLSSGVGKLGDSMLDAFRNGESAGRAFKNALSEILQELAKMVFKLGVLEPLISSIFGQQPSSGGGGILGTIIGAIAGAFTGGGIGSSAGESFGSVVGAAGGQNPIIAAPFAHGGSFNVGGSGGTDSQMVKFRATPNERVTIETPAQQKAGKAGGGDTFIVDMRGASVEAVARLEKFVRKVNGSIEKRAVAAVTNSRGRNPELFGAR